ncbi:MAG: sodium:proton antiporter [Elainellaceae cyanobacterium]
MDISFDLAELMVTVVTAGIGAQVLGKALRVPSIVFLLFFGIALGSDGLGLVRPQQLGEGLETIVALSVALILFEGGLTLDLRSLNQISNSLQNLVTLGALITLLGGGIAAHYLAEFPWSLAFLYAALVVVTGPTVISPLLKQVRVERSVAALLEGEGVLIDPVGAILAVLILDIVVNGDPDPLQLSAKLVLRLGIGIVTGIAGGWGLSWFLRWATFLDENLKNLVALAVVWDLYSLTQFVSSESGLMAVVAAGITLSSTSVPNLRLLRQFKSQLTVLAVSVLFILLTADLSIASLFALGWGSVLTVLFLMLVVRPVSVWFCTMNSNLNWRQRLFAGWIGPKGIVSASVASLFAIFLTDTGINGGEAVKALVFLTIILTVVIQGLTAQGVANLLRVTEREATGAVIVGSNPLARLIARLFKERDEPVVLIDTNASALKEAEQEDLQVRLSSAMNSSALEEVGLDSMGTFLAMTNNSEVNLVLAQRAAEEFAPPKVLAVFPREVHQGSVLGKVQQAFTGGLPLSNWNSYLREGQVKLVETVLRAQEFVEQRTYFQALIDAGSLIPLLVERQGHLQVVQAEQNWLPGDRLICLVHDPKPKLLKWLSGNQAARLTIEQLPTVAAVSMRVPEVKAV